MNGVEGKIEGRCGKDEEGVGIGREDGKVAVVVVGREEEEELAW